MPHRRHEHRQHERQRQRVEGVEERGAAHDDAGAQVPAREGHALEPRDQRRGGRGARSRAGRRRRGRSAPRSSEAIASGCSIGVRCRAFGRTVSVDCGIASCRSLRHRRPASRSPLRRRRSRPACGSDGRYGARVDVAQQRAARGVALEIVGDEHVQRPLQRPSGLLARNSSENQRVDLEVDERRACPCRAPLPRAP